MFYDICGRTQHENWTFQMSALHVVLSKEQFAPSEPYMTLMLPHMPKKKKIHGVLTCSDMTHAATHAPPIADTVHKEPGPWIDDPSRRLAIDDFHPAVMGKVQQQNNNNNNTGESNTEFSLEKVKGTWKRCPAKNANTEASECVSAAKMWVHPCSACIERCRALSNFFIYYYYFVSLYLFFFFQINMFLWK